MPGRPRLAWAARRPASGQELPRRAAGSSVRAPSWHSASTSGAELREVLHSSLDAGWQRLPCCLSFTLNRRVTLEDSAPRLDERLKGLKGCSGSRTTANTPPAKPQAQAPGDPLRSGHIRPSQTRQRANGNMLQILSQLFCAVFLALDCASLDLRLHRRNRVQSWPELFETLGFCTELTGSEAPAPRIQACCDAFQSP